MPTEKTNYPQLATDSEPSAVAEVQGLYGLFSFPEKLLQKIWDRGEFDTGGARTLDDRKVEVVRPGRWNRLGGPDFRDARLRFDEHEVIGDIEVHLREEDWAAHRHAEDAAYANVVLHVVLFPPVRRVTWTAGVREKRIPVLVLLPLLHRGLEEYAAEDAVESLANRPLDRAGEALGALEKSELGRVLREHARARWAQKVGFARSRIERLGWEGACHHTTLEILGYRFNRAPMLAVATEHPLAAWRDGAERVNVDEVFEARRERWQLQGVRPLNHPRLRLRQYAAWVKARPDWPETLRERSAVLRAAAVTAVEVSEGEVATSSETREGREGETRAMRAAMKLMPLRKRLASELCDGVVNGSRFDTLMCDGFLPLLAAEAGPGKRTDDGLEVLWRVWFAGDMPAERVRLLRRLGVFGAGAPVAHGPLQGLLGWLLARDASQR